MKYLATIKIMPLPALLDPAGKTIEGNLSKVSSARFENVRIGKCIELWVDAPNAKQARQSIEDLCEKMLCNRTVETYTIELRAFVRDSF